MLSTSMEWHMKGTFTWIASSISITLSLVLLVVHLRHFKRYSATTLYVVLIALNGILMTVMEQATFIKEHVRPDRDRPWMETLRNFALSSYSSFMRDFFTNMVDTLIAGDCLIRYIIICDPEKKKKYLGKKGVGLTILLMIGLSSLFSALQTRMKQDLDAIQEETLLPPPKYTWVYYIVLNIVVKVMVFVFHVVFVVRIRVSLNGSIAFLSKLHRANNNVRVYERIIKFSLIICSIVGFFNVLVTGIQTGLMVYKHLAFNRYFVLSILRYAAVCDIVKYSVNIIVFLKTACYGGAYIWLKCQ